MLPTFFHVFSTISEDIGFINVSLQKNIFFLFPERSPVVVFPAAISLFAFNTQYFFSHPANVAIGFGALPAKTP